MNNFAYFIASYGKPENIPTLNALEKINPKYPIYIVVGEDDPKLDQYKETYTNLLIFDKKKYRDQIDCIGTYAKSDKICTYSRVAVQDFAEKLDIRYIGYLFDDIKKFRLRYEKDNQIKGLDKFDMSKLIDMYIELLNSSPNIYIVGPPQSSFYIGANPQLVKSYTNRYGNFFIYDRLKKLEPFKANTLEDMSLLLYNNMVGKLSICPFGLQVICRDPAKTKDSYGNMTALEYYEQFVIIDSGHPLDVNSPTIHYKNYLPKIVSDKIETNTKRRLF